MSGRRPGFATRLLLAQVLVLVAGGLTTWLVASLVGPGLFHDHLAQAGDGHTSAETDHIDQAFTSALLVSLLVAVLASVAAALAVTWWLSRRVQHSIDTVAAAAAEISAGRFHTRVPPPGLGAEFDTLATGYNELAARLEAVEGVRRRMLADLAHEMRTPLATVRAHLEAVEDGVRDLDAQTLGVLRTSTDRLQRLAEDIAAVSRAEEQPLTTSPEDLDAGAVAQAALDAAAGRCADKGVDLRGEVTPGARVLADRDRLGQVLGNLLDNALRHTPAGGTITLSCRPERGHGHGWVRYDVADTGEGVAAEHLPHLFDRFYRVDTARDRAHGGSGIGLAISKALVEAHGGTITVESAGPGRGTTFTVRLPAPPRHA